MNELALFAGAGGGILGGHLLGWRTVCAVEWEAYPASVLVARQNDKILPPFPIWDDVQTFDGKPWRGIVDVVSGGFPCQDISAAGKGEGIDGERSGMWREMARIIHEVRPKFVFVENSPMLTSRGLGRVLGDLASMGFDARWGVLGAADVGANHQRDRIWIVAKWNRQISHSMHNGFGWRKQQPQSLEKTTFADTRCKSERPDQGLRPESEISVGENTSIVCGEISNTTSIRPSGQGQSEQSVNSAENRNRKAGQSINVRKSCFWAAEPDVGRVANGVASRVDRLKAIGNGQVSEVARRAWEILGDKG
jgi:DNA (cytosine-5)-methyltransferase 1